MSTSQPAILSALEQVIDKAKCSSNLHSTLTRTPLIEQEGDYLCSAFLTDMYDTVNYAPFYDETITKVRCNTFEVVFWGDHPLDGILENEILEGELSEEDAEDCPQSLVDLAEECLNDVITEELHERLGIDAEVISKESQSYCPMGGWSVIVKSKNVYYSVDCQPAARARVVSA